MEYKGHIQNLPAYDKIVFIEFLKGCIQSDLDDMIKYSKSVCEFKLDQLEKLKKLCTCYDKTQFILDVLSQ